MGGGEPISSIEEEGRNMPFEGRKRSGREKCRGEQSSWRRKKIRQEQLIAVGIVRK